MLRIAFAVCLYSCGPLSMSLANRIRNHSHKTLEDELSKRMSTDRDGNGAATMSLAQQHPADIHVADVVRVVQEDDGISRVQGYVKADKVHGSVDCKQVSAAESKRKHFAQKVKFVCKCASGLMPMICEVVDGEERCKVDGDRCGMHGKFYKEGLMGQGCKCRAPPIVSAPKFDEEEALLYLQYARASFCTNYSVTNWDCGDACEEAEVVPGKVRHLAGPKKKGTGYVAQLPSANSSDAIRCIVAFRGSEDIENWVANFQYPKTQWPSWCPECLVHSGFLQTYLELREPVFEALRVFQCQEIALAGHSLGGAVAQLAALELRHDPSIPKVGPVWTFGMPRVGNSDFVGAFMWEAKKRSENPPLWRVVHFKDPVPHVPPPTLPSFSSGWFRHPPTEVYYTGRKISEHVVCPSSLTGEENKECSNSHIAPIGPDHMVYLGKTTVFGDMHPYCKHKGPESGSSWA